MLSLLYFEESDVVEFTLLKLFRIIVPLHCHRHAIHDGGILDKIRFLTAEIMKTALSTSSSKRVALFCCGE